MGTVGGLVGLLLVARAGAAEAVGGESHGAAPEPTAQSADSESARLERAQLLFDDGLRLVDEERWAEARDRFAAASVLVERPSIFYNLAFARYRLSEFVGALDALGEYERAAPVDDERRDQARDLRGLLEPLVATVELQLEPSTASVRLDGAPLPGAGGRREFRVDPGRHRIESSHPGYVARSEIFDATPGRTVALHFALETEPARVSPVAAEILTAPPPALPGEEEEPSWVARPWFWAATGVALVAVGATVAYVATRERETAPADRGSTGLSFEWP